MLASVQVVELPARRFAVRRHDGPEATVEDTRRPMYQHLIMHELVGGPPVLRFTDAGEVDVLVGTTEGFQGDDEVSVEKVPAGWFAVAHFEGAPEDLPAARRALEDWCDDQGHPREGALLQVHLMDAIEGVTEQELQVPIGA